MNDKLEEYINLTYSIEVIPDQTTEGEICYMAKHPELPGCMSHGDTPEEAINNLIDAKKIYIETLLEKGQNPSLPVVTPAVLWKVVASQEEIVKTKKEEIEEAKEITWNVPGGQFEETEKRVTITT